MARPRRRRIAWLLLPAGLGALLWLVQSDVVVRIAARALEAVTEQALGEDVEVGNIEVSYLPPHVEVQDLVVRHRATGEEVVSVAAVRVQPGFRGPRPVISKLEIERPVVSLHLDADGLREFRDMPSVTGETAERFPWEELWISDGRFSLAYDGGAVTVDGIASRPGAEGANDVTVADLHVVAPGFDQRATDVRLPGVTLAPDRVLVPDIDLAFDALRVDGHAGFIADGPLGGDLSVQAQLARLTRGEEPGDYVDGVIDLDVALDGTLEAPAVSGALRTRDVVIWTPGTLPTRIGDAEGLWTLHLGDAPTLDLDPLHMVWGEGDLQASAVVDLVTLGVEGEVLAEGVSLAGILAEVGAFATPWVDLRGDVEVHAKGTIKPLAIEGPFEIGIATFRVLDGPLDDPASELMLAIDSGTLVGDMFFDAERIVLDGHRLVAGRPGGPHSIGKARADIGIADNGALAVGVDFSRLDLSQLAPLGDVELGGIATLQGFLGGPYEAMTASGRIEARDFRVLDLRAADTLTATIESDLTDLNLGDIHATLGRSTWLGDYRIDFEHDLAMDTQIYVPGGWIKDFTDIFLDIGPADGRLSGTLTLAGGPYDLTGEARLELRDVDLYGEHFPEGEALAWMDDGELTLEHLALRRGSEAVLARGSVKKEWKLNAEILTDGLRLERLDHLAPAGLPLTGELQADVQVGGLLDDPEPRGRVVARGVRYRGEPVADSAIAFTTREGVLAWEGTLAGRAGRVDGTLGLWGEQPYAIQARFDHFPVHVFYPEGEDKSPIRADLSGDVALSGAFGDDPIPVDIEARFPEVRLAWSGHALSNPEPWAFSVHGRDFSLAPMKLVGNDGTSLTFEGKADGAGGVAFSGGGSFDLDLLRAVVPDLEEARGVGEVRVTVVGGPDGEVDTDVVFETRRASMRSAYFPATFENLSAKVEASPDGYRIPSLTASVGGGRFVLQPSRILADGWVPTRYELAGRVSDTTVRYLDYLPPLTGDAELRFDGPADDLLLSGRIDIEDMTFRDRIDWEAMVLSLRQERITATAPEESGRYFDMNLEVVADDTVHLRNNVADAEASADLRIVGDTSRPGMVGEIQVTPGGQVYLHEREFEVTRGEMRYVDPYTYDPELDIVLETDVRSHEQDYRVTYAISGPFSDWRTTTDADPWLAQADINALLLFGVTREELERYGGLGTALVAETGDLLLAQTAISRVDLRFVDRWNLVSGVSERGSTTVSSELRLVAQKEVEGFEFTVEKNLGADIGTDWYASVERRIARRIYAAAYVSQRQEGRALPIGAAYGAEFKLRWELD